MNARHANVNVQIFIWMFSFYVFIHIFHLQLNANVKCHGMEARVGSSGLSLKRNEALFAYQNAWPRFATTLIRVSRLNQSAKPTHT
jgi:hypothetical protein